MKLILLHLRTSDSQQPVVVVANHVREMRLCDNGKFTYTRLHFGTNYWSDVHETPTEICTLIEQAQKGSAI